MYAHLVAERRWDTLRNEGLEHELLAAPRGIVQVFERVHDLFSPLLLTPELGKERRRVYI